MRNPWSRVCSSAVWTLLGFSFAHELLCVRMCVCVRACCWWLLLYAAGYFPCSERVFVSSKRRSECLKTFVRVMCVWIRNRVNHSKCRGVKKDECSEGKMSGDRIALAPQGASGRTKDSDASDFLLISAYLLRLFSDTSASGSVGRC